MSNEPHNVVGIDVSKGKSTIAVMRPFGEIVIFPFEVKHTSSDLKVLADTLNKLDGETRVVMEYTGKYYQPVARYLNESVFTPLTHFDAIHRAGYFFRELSIRVHLSPLRSMLVAVNLSYRMD